MTKKPEDNPVDLDQIRELIDLLIEKDVAELEIERGGVKVKIRRTNGVATTVAALPQAAASPQALADSGADTGAEPETPAEAAGLADAYIVTSPMVGTFYRSPEPGADAFADVGDHIAEGQTLCIVEAMKLMNEITSEVGGEVLAVFADNAEPVEFGQQLFAIRPGA